MDSSKEVDSDEIKTKESLGENTGDQPAKMSDLKTQPNVYTSTKGRFRSDPVIAA